MRIENEIDHLNQMIIKMANQVLNNLRTAIELYKNYDENKLMAINDDIVDLHERLIEEMCLDIMVKERPYARDLRKVSGILKLVTDLERLGDHAEDISNFAKKLQNVEHHECHLLDQMIEKSFIMVENSIKSYVELDTLLASSVIKEDDEIDSLYEKALDKIINHLNEKEYSNEFGVFTTLIIKYMERIADHAVNIAEWVIYIESGYHKDMKIF